MRQFDYLQIIPRPPYDSAPPDVRHKDFGVILDDFENHLVPEEYHRVSAPFQWAYDEGYMT